MDNGSPTWVNYLEIIQITSPLELVWIDYLVTEQFLENITVMMGFFTQYKKPEIPQSCLNVIYKNKIFSIFAYSKQEKKFQSWWLHEVASVGGI